MKQIDITKMIKDNDLDYLERLELIGMEFIKRDDGNYIIKDSGFVVSEKEKIQMENKELVIKDISSPCAKNITKELSKNKKKIEELEKLEDIEETEPVKE